MNFTPNVLKEVTTVVNVAHAAASQGGGGAGDLMGFALPMVLMVAIFYFILIRPQQRKAKGHRQFLENLKRDERVITAAASSARS